MVTQTPELRLMYDDEAKAALDRFSELEDAREEGKLIGELQGRLQGRLQGKLMGEIQLLQRLLMLTISTDEELEALTPDKLQRMAIELNQRQASDN